MATIVSVYDLFPPSPTPIQQRFQAPPSPPPRSHYRPFSTLYTESPYIDIPDKPRFLKRASSVGGLHALSSMGLHFMTKKDVHRISPKHAKSASIKVAAPKTTDAPSSGSSPRPTHFVQKKRSMASLFSTSETLVSEPRTPPLDTSPVISAFPKPNGRHRTSLVKESTLVDHDAAQDFVPRNLWSRRYSMRLHLSSIKNVNALENDRYSELLLQRLSGGSPSFHEYAHKPPRTVLDLGCGPGYWLLHTANVWKTSQITGIDFVDVTIPEVKMTENVQFLQYNFLLRLPFADKSFEYVRMANLVFCIPHKYWHSLLSEVRRILTSNGRLEIIDDQLYFPYGDPPSDHIPSSNRSSSFYDDFDDNDTLQGEDSADSEATLISEGGSNRSSFENKQKPQVSESATARTITAYLPKTPENAAVREPAVFKRSPPLQYDPEFGESKQEGWRRKAFHARDLETVFEKMLEKDYGISPRPSEFIVDMLMGVFGKRAAGKTKSFQIKLAPTDSPIGPDTWKEEDFLEEENSSSPQKRTAYVPSEWEKQQKKKKDKKKDVVGTSSSSQRSSSGSDLTSTPLPSSLSTKAADLLGLSVPPPPGSPIEDKSKVSPPDRPSTPVLSAKAAGRLGISYTALAAATVSSARGRPIRAKPRHPTQSPGLLVWPSTYIPVDPVELEFHGNKHMHTLLGCKAALAEHVAMCLDESGNRLIEEDELDHALFEYDSFRRTRLNWPDSIPDPYDDEPNNALAYLTPLSLDLPTLKQVEATMRSEGNDFVSNGQYQRDELTHIRTIRVFEATKLEEHSLASMFSSRAP